MSPNASIRPGWLFHFEAGAGFTSTDNLERDASSKCGEPYSLNPNATYMRLSDKTAKENNIFNVPWLSLSLSRLSALSMPPVPKS